MSHNFQVKLIIFYKVHNFRGEWLEEESCYQINDIEKYQCGGCGALYTNSEIEKFDYSYSYDDDDEPVLKLEPGYYIQMSAPSKYSTEFELDVEEEDFDASKLKLSLTSIALPCEDEYGEVDMTILTSVEYDGIDYNDDMMDNMVDRGYTYRHTVIEVFDNGTYDEIFEEN